MLLYQWHKKRGKLGLPFLSIQCFLKAKRGKGPAQKGPRALQGASPPGQALPLAAARWQERGLLRPGQKGQALPPPAGVGKPESPSLADPGGHFDHDTRGGLKSLVALTLGQSTQILLTILKKLKVPLMSGKEHIVL